MSKPVGITFTQAASPSKLPSLTGLRFVAATLVVGFHASLTEIIGFNPFADAHASGVFQTLFNDGGWIGVSFFFVLSGFVITWSARSDDTPGRFIRRRLLKIYPNHIVTWALTLALFSAAATPVSVWLPNLLLVHSWIPREHVFLSINGPSWSLCCELFFYVLFPFLIKPILRLPENRLWRWAAATAVALLVTQLLIERIVPGTPYVPEWPISEQRWWWAYFLPPARLFEFVLGMLMARILKEGRWIGLGLAPAFALIVAGYVLASFTSFQFKLNVVTIVPIALFITAIAAADVAGRKTGFAGRTMVWLGDVSFGMYMIHQLVLVGAKQWMHGQRFGTPTATFITMAALGASIVGGWLLFTCIERPVMLRWGRVPPKIPRLMRTSR